MTHKQIKYYHKIKFFYVKMEDQVSYFLSLPDQVIEQVIFLPYLLIIFYLYVKFILDFVLSVSMIIYGECSLDGILI